MKKWLLLVSLALCVRAWAEKGGSESNIRKIGPEESKAVLKDAGIVIKDRPTYPDTAYRLYPKPYRVFELATAGYSPFEQEDGSPLNGTNPDDVKYWGPDGEPVVILVKLGVGEWMEGFFSRKRVAVELDRYTYRYRKTPSDRKEQGETADPNVEVLQPPKDYDPIGIKLFSSSRDSQAISSYVASFNTPGVRDDSIFSSLREIDTLPYPFDESKRKEALKPQLKYCEPLDGFIQRVDKKFDGGRPVLAPKVYWSKAIVRYYPPGQTPPKGNMPWCRHRTPLVSWPDGSETVNHGNNGQPHLLPDGSVLVKLGADAVVRLRWEDGEPAGPLPPFIKVIDAREVIWAKLDLLRRYRDELRRRGQTNADITKLRTPEQVMHDLAAYFFDIREIRNWKEGNSK